MKLHRFHISKLRDTGLKRDRSTYALANDGVCGVFIHSAVAAGSDQRALRNVCDQLTGNQIAHDCAVAAVICMD